MEIILQVAKKGFNVKIVICIEVTLSSRTVIIVVVVVVGARRSYNKCIEVTLANCFPSTVIMVSHVMCLSVF
jgi:hypothetical protein